MTLDELEKICDAATQGVWYSDYGVSMRTAWAFKEYKTEVIVLNLDSEKNLTDDVNGINITENIEFIETFNPQRVKQMIGLLRDAKNFVGTEGSSVEQFDAFEAWHERLEQFERGGAE